MDEKTQNAEQELIDEVAVSAVAEESEVNILDETQEENVLVFHKDFLSAGLAGKDLWVCYGLFMGIGSYLLTDL